MLLAEAYAGAGRTAEAIDLARRARRRRSASAAVAGRFLRTRASLERRRRRVRPAVQRAPRNLELKTRYAQTLLNAGGRDNIVKARDVLTEVVAGRATDAFALYLLSQAQRRSGDGQAAEATARRLIAQNSRSPRGYFALAEALEERHQYQAVVDELAPVVARNRGRSGDDAAFDIGILLPHLGFAYQELGAVRQGDRDVRGGPPSVAEGSVACVLRRRRQHRGEEIRQPPSRRRAWRAWTIPTICG